MLSEKFQELEHQGECASTSIKPEEWDKLREMIARCKWTFAKIMPWAPHE